MISKAAAFHDIGKISISESILNKPGRLTEEEFEIMKTHSAVGADMLENLPLHRDEPLVKIAYEICRWHHERYDGNGYSDGLKGEEIPISAQAVSLADAYDALISERVYKKAFSHEKALSMILNGECGAFHPLLLECLSEIADHIQEELSTNSLNRVSEKEIHNIVDRLLSHKELANSNRTLSMLEEERIKFQFFASMASEIQFEYSVVPSMITISDWGTEKLGISRFIVNPSDNQELLSIISREKMIELDQILRCTTPDSPIVEYEVELEIDGKTRLSRIFSAMTGEYDGFKISVSMGIAKAADVGRNYNDLYHCADLALFDAKRKGQGRYVFYDEKKCNTNAPTTISPMIHPLKNNGGTEYDVGRIISGDCRKLSGYQRTAEKRGAD